ncbi:hypothetical protein P691DRAFT_765315 [Macrolepiota fuliginosa MF-IS2]|uniref:Uncharacterized protein n=1 Tax=Macrolepiota fuliginosa MF-IS2 TaxID=1400762 RepID=A0A9P5X0N5_9AGAR|nr:hypothetical protein P691DRAFT_765315 [Macrolepiota fuliginosa MF-IS2]
MLRHRRSAGNVHQQQQAQAQAQVQAQAQAQTRQPRTPANTQPQASHITQAALSLVSPSPSAIAAGTAGTTAAMNPPGTNHVQANTTSNNNPTGAATHRIHLVPHLDTRRSLCFDPSAAIYAKDIPSSASGASLTVLALDSPPSILSIPADSEIWV